MEIPAWVAAARLNPDPDTGMTDAEFKIMSAIFASPHPAAGRAHAEFTGDLSRLPAVPGGTAIARLLPEMERKGFLRVWPPKPVPRRPGRPARRILVPLDRPDVSRPGDGGIPGQSENAAGNSQNPTRAYKNTTTDATDATDATGSQPQSARPPDAEGRLLEVLASEGVERPADHLRRLGVNRIAYAVSELASSEVRGTPVRNRAGYLLTIARRAWSAPIDDWSFLDHWGPGGLRESEAPRNVIQAGARFAR